MKNRYSYETSTDRYPNGYQPKIEYWTYKMNKAIKNLDPSAIEFASAKLMYFVGRQAQVNERVASVYS